MIAMGITWGTIIVSEKTAHIGHHRHQCLHIVHKSSFQLQNKDIHVQLSAEAVLYTSMNCFPSENFRKKKIDP